MDKNSSSRHPYRWIVLAVFFMITVIVEMHWLAFAPIARDVRNYYNVSANQVDLLSELFMGLFLVMCVPASYVIDKKGIRIGISIGAALTGIFGLLKGIYADSYTMIVVCQVFLAIGQPFLLNASTKVAVRWFPLNERATAVGIATLAQFVGIITVMMATPYMIRTEGSDVLDFPGMLMTYGVISIVGAILTLLLLRERPAGAAENGANDESFHFYKVLKDLAKKPDIIKVLVLFFIGLGIFNSVSTCIDQLCEQKGLSVEETGLVGGMMLIAGILGAIILPAISDKMGKRKPFVILAMLFMAIGIAGLNFFSDYTLLLVSSGLLGFFLLGAGAPVGFQYSAEVAAPSPESTTQGLILLTGQVSGILFVLGINHAGIMPFMKIFIVLSIIAVALTLSLNESPLTKPSENS